MIEFLDLLKMPAEPGTEKVVAHLEHCKAAQLPANDTTYAILYERLESADAACIDRLVGTDFIYDAKLERYLKAENVFWEVPAIGGRWHTASARLRQYWHRSTGLCKAIKRGRDI
jgi:hypothetical protein